MVRQVRRWRPDWLPLWVWWLAGIYLLGVQLAAPTVRASEPSSVAEMLAAAQAARNTQAYLIAARYAEQAIQLGTSETQADALAELGLIYLTAECLEPAADYFQTLARRFPDDPRGLTGLATVALAQGRLDDCEQQLKTLLTRYPNTAGVHVVGARLFIERNQVSEARHHAEQAVALAPEHPEALAALCAVRVMERKPQDVRQLAERILERQPNNIRVRRTYSQYIRSQKAHPVPPAEARVAYAAAQAARQQHDIAAATRYLDQALTHYPDFFAALLSRAALAIEREDIERAEALARRALALDPHHPLPHLQLSLVNLARHEMAARELGARIPDVDFHGAPTTIADIETVFPNIETLTPRQKQIVLGTVAPLAHLLPKLQRCGAKHWILPLDRQLGDLPGCAPLAERATFDGRYYGSLRGVGGVVTVSGIETLRAVEHGGFNTLAHEFAHQIHSCALDTATLDRIEKLYDAAVREGRALDYYAASDKFEYFAQGYEAYVSTVKRRPASPTAGHTRADLARRDPKLFALFEELTQRGTVSAETTPRRR
ncbi:MAG: tetratricopeptide repeat protein [Chloracidobacterium sp.]|uniref:tetratricopeptide repeat protein n=1 Tax=Chloracidobacterium validum TaxID=2821543 RepID=UPI001FE7F35B|nr:tetratricopeptide repeat protein [Chloracidobacterium validum]